MSRQNFRHDSSESLDVFPAFTDLMSNAFMILSLFLLLALIEAYRLNHNLAKANERLQSATPILIDEKSGKFSFTSNSAKLSPDLKNYLNEKKIPEIQSILQKHDIDFIQVIGYTDSQEINRTGNLDRKLDKVTFNQEKVDVLVPGSNTDLGLMRALAIIQEIERSGKVKNIRFQAYSAGQIYDENGQLIKFDREDNPKLRRIEIRFIPHGQKNTD
ncbi:MAG: flagellar motor protein [Synechocystis sp.]|jgi:outer membrane protein OmpA-like peptidoglycan-associated protein